MTIRRLSEGTINRIALRSAVRRSPR